MGKSRTPWPNARPFNQAKRSLMEGPTDPQYRHSLTKKVRRIMGYLVP